MSTAPLSFEASDEPLLPSSALPRRGLLILLPFALIGALGFGLPALAFVQAGAATAAPVVRIPYAGRLEPILSRKDLDLEVLRALDAEHRRLLDLDQRFGGITEKDEARLQRHLDRYLERKPR